MQMRRTALAGLTLTALLITTPVALASGTADDTGPGTQACTDATGLEVSAQAALDVALDAVLDLSPALLDDLDDRGDLLGDGVLDGLLGDPEAGEGAQADITAAIQAVADLDVAVGDREEACTAPDGGEPSPTTSVTPPAGDGDELDCVDFPLADGTTAQDVLDADPADPNRLDLDSDRRACELLDDAPDSDADGDEDFDQLGGSDRVPSGGVATGA